MACKIHTIGTIFPSVHTKLSSPVLVDGLFDLHLKYFLLKLKIIKAIHSGRNSHIGSVSLLDDFVLFKVIGRKNFINFHRYLGIDFFITCHYPKRFTFLFIADVITSMNDHVIIVVGVDDPTT